LYYELAGSHGPPVVCVHGMWCDHTYFGPQVLAFADRHRVLLPDLLGHGRSDKPDVDLSIPDYADQVAGLCQHTGLNQVVAVGHSMGGAVAVSLAARHPELVRAIAVLDTTLLAGEKVRHQIIPALATRLDDEPPLQALGEFLSPMFGPDDGPEIRQRVEAAVAAAPLHVTRALMRAIAAWDGRAELARVACPLLYVGSSTPRTSADALTDAHVAAQYGRVIGSGHFVTLLAAEQVNAMLDRFLCTLPDHTG
jgi:pimeloyl-ACP methyl ester carboxylesterase